MEKIKIENLSFAYPNHNIAALKNINITINAGEFVTICGKSGCGKSTLLRQLKPMLSYDGKKSGCIYIDNRDITELTHREQAEEIGFVMQNPDSQIVCDKVWHELAFGLENLSYDTAEIRAKVAEMAAFFGIQDWYYKSITRLSGGQKQLLCLAAIMVMQPSVLILDEPTSQLDPIAAHEFIDTLVKINNELGTTIILSEHRLEEALPVSHRVIVLGDGEVVANGDVASVGKQLKEANDDMLLALPTPMRVYYSLKNDNNCPVTIYEGRQWISKTPVNKELEFKDIEIQSKSASSIKLKDIWYRYERNSDDILKGVNLDVYENEFYAIVGGNGSGKTTLLSVIAGTAKPYCGKIDVAGRKKIVALPQNPKNIFVKNTVLAELQDAFDNNIPKDIKDKKIENVVKFCELEELLNYHPYDLSGGEQQRAALAKVLLYEPDVLLLDEPTKGLDAHFKLKLAQLIKNLNENNIAVVMVSHDTEFCAKYANRTAMLFDGQIISEAASREFFSGKSFYTTAANKMARDILPNAVVDDDIITAIGGTTHSSLYIDKPYVLNQTPAENNTSIKSRPKLTFISIIFGAIFALIFCVIMYYTDTSDYTIKGYAIQLVGLGFAAISLYCFIPKKKVNNFNVQPIPGNKKIQKRTIFSAVMILLLIPLTILAGIIFLEDRKYYFISLLVILETILPFMLIFEGRHPQSRELVIISVMCAIAVAGRVVFAFLPQFKPVIAIIIISGICFGGETGFLVGSISAFVSNFYFTQGPWTPWQMFAFGIIGFLAGILYRKELIGKSKKGICIFGFLSTLVIYGGIMNPASVIMSQEQINIQMILSSYIMGFPLDVIHAASTAFFLWFAAEPMCEKIERVKSKYGLTNNLQ